MTTALCLFLALQMGAAGGTTPADSSAKANRLLTGKILAVAPMPAGLDTWIIQQLRGWGRYQATEQVEGADLEMVAHRPERKPIQFTQTRQGVPQPKQKHWYQRKKTPPIVLSVGVVDWVTGDSLWHADIINAKPPKDYTPTTGPKTQIYAKGLSPAELAIRITTTFRRYVDQLAAASAAAQKPLNR